MKNMMPRSDMVDGKARQLWQYKQRSYYPIDLRLVLSLTGGIVLTQLGALSCPRVSSLHPTFRVLITISN